VPSIGNIMKKVRLNTFRRLSAAASLALFLLLVIFSSSEQLHKLIHPDADSPGHQCAITMLAQGQVNAPTSSLVVVAFVSALLFVLPPLRTSAVSAFDYRFSASRAPPLV
jgi:hypothetical protein